MANILLISYFFPPHNAVGCRRVYSWAKYLKQLGHNVIILTSENPGDESMKSYDVDLSFLEVYRLKYFNILDPLMKVFKPRNLLCVDQRAAPRRSWLFSFFKKILNFTNTHFSSRGILLGCSRFPTVFEGWFFPAYKQAKKIIRERNIDVIITSSPPPTINIVGFYLRKKFSNILWVADYRDLWVDNPVNLGVFPFTLFERYFERRCISLSDIIIVVSKGMSDKVANKYPHKKTCVFCIENGYDEEVFEMIKSNNVNPVHSGLKKIIYAGTLYYGRRNPEPLFKIIEENHEFFKDKLKVSFYGGYETRRILDTYNKRYLKAGEIIKYEGFLSAQDIIKKESEADVLLFIENDKYDDGVYSGKIFEYMIIEKPVICMGINPDTSIGNMLKKTGLCFFCGDDLTKLEDVLRLLVNDNKINISPDREYIKSFSRRNQAERVNAILESHLNRTKH